ncbi:class I SAM-dependent methyltransferase [bacterium]|nr:class I SAM-dependent methyltransferase [bacterium]
MDPDRRLAKFRKTIHRQRLRPRIWDYSYFLLKNNVEVFKKYRDLLPEAKENLFSRARVLDVGCGFKPWEEVLGQGKYRYIGIDFDPIKSFPDVIASDDSLPFRDNAFSALIYSEVLEHSANLSESLREMRRVAIPGALVFLSSPLVFPEHGVPHDFQRLTKYHYEKVFGGDDLLVLQGSNSSLSTAIVAVNLFFECTPLSVLVGFKNILYALTNSVALIMDCLLGVFLKILGNKYRQSFYGMPLGYAVVVRIRK